MAVALGSGSDPVLSALGAVVVAAISFLVLAVAAVVAAVGGFGIGGGRAAADAARDACAAAALAASLAERWLVSTGTCRGGNVVDDAAAGAAVLTPVVALAPVVDDDGIPGAVAAAPAAVGAGTFAGITRGADEAEEEEGDEAGFGVARTGRTMVGALLSFRLAAASLRRMGLAEEAAAREEEGGADLRCSPASATAASASCCRSCSALGI